MSDYIHSRPRGMLDSTPTIMINAEEITSSLLSAELLHGMLLIAYNFLFCNAVDLHSNMACSTNCVVINVLSFDVGF